MAAVATNKPHLKFRSIFIHDLVSTYFGGHLMPESAALQKVRRNSRLRTDSALAHMLLLMSRTEIGQQ